MRFDTFHLSVVAHPDSTSEVRPPCSSLGLLGVTTHASTFTAVAKTDHVESTNKHKALLSSLKAFRLLLAGIHFVKIDPLV